MTSKDCRTGIHGICNGCDCACHKEECNCVIVSRHRNETQAEWLKRSMCLHHWMQTDYYAPNTNPNTEGIRAGSSTDYRQSGFKEI